MENEKGVGKGLDIGRFVRLSSVQVMGGASTPPSGTAVSLNIINCLFEHRFGFAHRYWFALSASLWFYHKTLKP